ncbi:MAG: N-acetyltransferase [Candidatus Brevundimonas phytovorans]|nr:N-acetyltransferase [Brevundimonas sp.]WEK57040.1 MAG: N-acetyltransferase [Brevundimonas sp.]
MILRPETETDRAAIQALTAAAFDGHPHSDGSEPRIIEALRDAGALTLSLVAEVDGQVVGHAAFSPVEWPGQGDWFGLGPVSVAPDSQNQGIGRQLIEAGLDDLRRRGARGCVVMGEPAYYGRFGFVQDPRLTYPGPPPDYFMALAFGAIEGSGEVRYHPAFG